jgi:orotate phosphoribosyltransferase
VLQPQGGQGPRRGRRHRRLAAARPSRALVVDDVITAGTAIREVKQIVDGEGATLAGIVVAVDRQERGTGELSAIQEVARDFEVPVVSIIGFDQVVEYLEQTGLHGEHLDAVRSYREEFGVSA